MNLVQVPRTGLIRDAIPDLIQDLDPIHVEGEFPTSIWKGDGSYSSFYGILRG